MLTCYCSLAGTGACQTCANWLNQKTFDVNGYYNPTKLGPTGLDYGNKPILNPDDITEITHYERYYIDGVLHVKSIYKYSLIDNAEEHY